MSTEKINFAKENSPKIETPKEEGGYSTPQILSKTETQKTEQSTISNLYEEIDRAYEKSEIGKEINYIDIDDRIKTPEEKPEIKRKLLGKAGVIAGFLFAGLLSHKEASAQKEKIKIYTDSIEYNKANKLYKDSLELHKNSTYTLKKLTNELGVKPKIVENDRKLNIPFDIMFYKNHPNIFFNGSESDKRLRDLVGPYGPSAYGKLDLKKETFHSLKERVKKAKKIREEEIAKNKTYSIKISGKLERFGVISRGGRMEQQKIIKNYNFIQPAHSTILPTKEAIFDIGSNYNNWTKDDLPRDEKHVFKQEHTRNMSDDVFKNEIVKPEKINMIKSLFGNTFAGRSSAP
jgi:hypothetical protein